MLAKFGACTRHDQWGTGRGGPILAAKISPGRPILAAKIGPGDHFLQKSVRGTTFGGDRFWCDRPTFIFQLALEDINF